jgi:hypothetical protein
MIASECYLISIPVANFTSEVKNITANLIADNLVVLYNVSLSYTYTLSFRRLMILRTPLDHMIVSFFYYN